MLETLIGGLLAISGGTAAQWLHNRHAAAQWRREASYDQRREAYTTFLVTIESYRRSVDQWAMTKYGQPPSEADWDDVLPLYDRITPIKVFGTRAAQTTAEAAFQAMQKYMNANGGDDQVTNELDTAIRSYIDQVRSDLQITDTPQTRPQ